jgi:GntR family transcriptional repressor for pyruvate dehydrogenase complex
MDDLPQGSNIAATIFVDLRRQILRGELAAGQRLPGERELATKYGTNRNTLREAVRKLEQSRLVTVRHGQGVTVTDFRRAGTLELLSPFLGTGPETGEIARILADLLPARQMVLEFASRLAVQRADETDIERLQDLSDLLVSAFEGGDPKIVAHGFHRWLDALIDAGHSVASRWIANPFLEAYRDLINRFPFLWVLDPRFIEHMREFMEALRTENEELAINSTRAYYSAIDEALLRMLDGPLARGAKISAASTGELGEADASEAKKPGG